MEAFSAVAIPLSVLVITQSLKHKISLELILANFIVSVFLIEGALFWFLKYIQYRNNSAFPSNALMLFRIVYYVNWGLVLIGIQTCVSRTMESGGISLSYNFIVTLVLLVMAILEQINYFHWQLMYDNQGDFGYALKHKKLKIGAIRREFIGSL